MSKIRLAEEGIAARYSQNKMRCPTHLSIGQECVPAVLGAMLSKDDLAVSTHRCHAHYLGKGGDLNAFIAELYGKVTGCSRGKGGSMHLIDEKAGFMGSTAIVGNSIPVGVGLGFALQQQKKKNVSIVFLGDGAIEEGAFYEAANFAVLKKLPVMFVCENNMYSVYSHLKVRQPDGRKIHRLAEAIGLQVYEGFGNDAFETWDLCKKGQDYALSGRGPSFVELATYRWREHCGPNYDNDIGYRTTQEFEEWKAKDPMVLFAATLKERGWMTPEEMKAVDAGILKEVEAAFEFAEKSAFPPADEAFSPIFKEGARL
jgi:TPP-dependent pyruvate/acetoin dehydrogenase alpha subunit